MLELISTIGRNTIKSERKKEVWRRDKEYGCFFWAYILSEIGSKVLSRRCVNKLSKRIRFELVIWECRVGE